MSNPSTAIFHVGLHADTNPTLRTQDTEQGGDTPDVNRPPEVDVPDFATEVPDVANDPGAPPFTGEDLEDAGKQRRRKQQQDEPNS